MKTVITELLGIEYPVIQGGMAWVGTAELAAAVSEAGGLGIIGAGGAPASWVEDQIHKVKEKTDKPFGVNLMLLNPEADAIADLLIKEGVKADNQNYFSARSSSPISTTFPAPIVIRRSCPFT